MEVKEGAVVVGRCECDELGRCAKSHVDSQSPANPNGVDAYVHFHLLPDPGRPADTAVTIEDLLGPAGVGERMFS